jgi:(p)ppGpp synthase/HD superfamily hydrolase
MLIVKAIQFASEKHKGQERRGSGLPYVTHPIIVSQLI